MSLQSIDVGGIQQSGIGHVRMSPRALENKTSKLSSPSVDHPGKHGQAAMTADDEDATPRVTGDGDARGVIRLLEEGHFKGVADVRLRINNFDELSSRANVAAGPVVEDQSRQLVATVEAQVDELIKTLAVDEEARQGIAGIVEDFDADVRALVANMFDAGKIDADALAGEIASLFDGLLGRLQDLLAEPIPEPAPSPDASAVDDVVSLDGVDGLPNDLNIESPDETDNDTDAPAINLEDALASLRSALDDALSTLVSSIVSAVQLPDPSPPSGNGVAYEKFTAIYNELRGDTPTIDNTA